MTVHRVMGIETEYGISVPGKPHVNAMLASSQIVNAYAYAALGERRVRTRWDYDEENPLRDARGFDLSRSDADPSQLTDEDLGLANVILTNGARLYVDHAHPEYSSPEVTNPFDAVLWDKAGERIMARAAQLAAASPGGLPLQLYKNNTDNKGASYGTHENYLMSRTTRFADIVTCLTPFFVSRQVFAGAGRLGVGQDGSRTGFQLSQRADFFEVEVGLETTIKRPIINTRDEPHADAEQYRRLHVIVGDSNMSETTTLLKVGSCDLVLRMIEEGFTLRDSTLDNPIRAIRDISVDLTGKKTVKLASGKHVSALDLQGEFLRKATDFAASRGLDDPSTTRVLDLWRRTLEAVESGDHSQIDTEIDWAIKHKLITAYVQKHGLDLNHPRVAQLDLAYHDVDPRRGLFGVLAARGLAARVVSDERIEEAKDLPPQTTRAKLRGDFIRAAKEHRRDYTVDWVHLKLNDQAQRTVLCKNPFLAEDPRVSRLIEGMEAGFVRQP